MRNIKELLNLVCSMIRTPLPCKMKFDEVNSRSRSLGYGVIASAVLQTVPCTTRRKGYAAIVSGAPSTLFLKYTVPIMELFKNVCIKNPKVNKFAFGFFVL